MSATPISAVIQEALSSQEHLEAVLRQILDTGDIDDQVDTLRAGLRRERDLAATRLGRAIVERLRSGIGVSFRPRGLVQGDTVTALEIAEPEVVAPEPSVRAHPSEEEGTNDESMTTRKESDQETDGSTIGALPETNVEGRCFEKLPARADHPASPTCISQLAERFAKRPTFNAHPHLVPSRGHSDQYLTLIMQMPAIRTAAEISAEIQGLDMLAKRLDELKSFPRLTQVQALGLLAARARRAQEAADERPMERQRLNRVFGRLSAWSDRERPGWVPGMARDHTPRLHTWEADCLDWLAQLGGSADQDRNRLSPKVMLRELQRDLIQGTVDDDQVGERFERIIRAGLSSNDPELLDCAEAHLSFLERSGHCKTLRRRLRERQNAEESAELAQQGFSATSAVPATIRAATQGRAAVIVGGDERGQAKERILAAFGFLTLDWERGWNTRRVQALRDRIASGSLTCVIFLRRFLNHDLSNTLVPACRESGALMVWVDQGYGVSAVERAIQRALGESEGSRG